MTRSDTPKNLTEPVEVRDLADAFLEATLPPSWGHREGTTERAEELLAQHPELARASIWTAAAAGEVEAARSFLEVKPALAGARGGTRNWEPLLYLCFSRLLRAGGERSERMLEVARLLLAHGADPDACWIDPDEGEGNRETALYGAAGVANQVELARLLIDAGADPNDGETAYHMVEHDGVPCADFIFPKLEPLHRGAALGHKLDYDDLEGLRRLLELGADPNGPRPFPNQALHQAVWRGRSRPFFELLAQYGADLDAPNRHGKTAYALAARAGRADIMQWLVELGASEELEDSDRFISACALGDRAAAQAALAQHPDLLARLSGPDRAVICEVAAAGNTAGIRIMLDLGWDVNTRGHVWNETPLHRAALEGHLETARLLLQRGASLTIRDRCYQSSPLGWARYGKHSSVVEMLSSDPSRLDLRDAFESGQVARVLELLGDSDVNAPAFGEPPGVLLRAAAAAGRLELVRALLERGADPALRDSHEKTAADLAAHNGHGEIQRLLSKHNSS